MAEIKHEKGTVTIKQVAFTEYKLGEKATLMHRVREDEETFEIPKSLKRDELYALRAVIDSLIAQEPEIKEQK